jgi:diacylglycerol kinase family enzyme
MGAGSRVKSSIVVLNASAGTMGEGHDAEARIRHAFAQRGSEFVVVVVKPEEVESAVRDGLKRGLDIVFVGGGDGTLATAARCLVGSPTALGVLPLGTRNHFARDLKIPLPIEEAVKAVLEGGVVEVDLGEVNGVAFINNVSIGVYPEAVAEREWHQRYAGMSKWRAWIHALVNVFWRYRMRVLHLKWDGRETIARTPFVFVGNNEYVVEAEEFGRRKSLLSGKLAAYYAPDIGRFRFLWNATKALLGVVHDGLNLEKIVTARLTVESRERRLDVAIDGEVHSFRPPLEFVVRPRVLRVVVPAPPP